jgi:hypothetical protein
MGARQVYLEGTINANSLWKDLEAKKKQASLGNDK